MAAGKRGGGGFHSFLSYDAEVKEEEDGGCIYGAGDVGRVSRVSDRFLVFSATSLPSSGFTTRRVSSAQGQNKAKTTFLVRLEMDFPFVNVKRVSVCVSPPSTVGFFVLLNFIQFL